MNKRVYRHVGYWNDETDCQFLLNKDANAIINFFRSGYGDLRKCDGESDSDIAELFTSEQDHRQMTITDDRAYLVRKEIGVPNCGGWYIDIYQLIEIDETGERVSTQEYCAECDTYVDLLPEFKVQVCPECGEPVVPCNLCPLLEESKCDSSKCPLARQAELIRQEKNEKLYGPAVTLEGFCEGFNGADAKQKYLGFYITISEIQQFICHYNLGKGCILIMPKDGVGLAFTIGGNKLNTGSLQTALERLSGKSSFKDIYVKEVLD